MNILFLLVTLVFFAQVANADSSGASVGNGLCHTNEIKPDIDINKIELEAKKNTKEGDYYKAILAGMYYRGAYVDIDLDKAFEFASSAIDKDTTGIAHYELAVLFNNNYRRDKKKAEQNYAQALPLLEKSAAANNAYAQYKLAYMVSNGLGGAKKNSDYANTLYKRSAENGYWQAFWKYARQLENNGKLASAEKWYCLGAQLGVADNMIELSDYFHRRHETTNKEEYRKSAESWFNIYTKYDSNSSRILDSAQAYQNGRMVKVDYGYAATLYEKVVQRESNSDIANEAKYYLAMLLHFKLIESREHDNERLLFKQAAEAGDQRARNMLEFLASLNR